MASINCGASLKNCATTLAPIPNTHVKALQSPYYVPAAEWQKLGRQDEKLVERFPLTKWESAPYSPAYLTLHEGSGRPAWADPGLNDDGFKTEVAANFNKGTRISHHGDYQTISCKDYGKGGRRSITFRPKQKVPRNPVGRTGLSGRGTLGRWGPNHAADPIVTRWKRDGKGNIAKAADGKQILEFVAIKRRDTGEWAIPGGMVDPGEQVSLTLARELVEEAFGVLGKTEEEQREMRQKITEQLQNEFATTEIYRGYVDDPRNTDNSWMETVAMNFHDKTGEVTKDWKLEAGDDASHVRWADVSSAGSLYASHSSFMKTVATNHSAHW